MPSGGTGAHSRTLHRAGAPVVALWLALHSSCSISGACGLPAVPSVELGHSSDPGTSMPAIGLGTGGYGNTQARKSGAYPECWSDGQPDPYGGPAGADCRAAVERAVLDWLAVGGRRIDSGDSYLNVPAVGAAMAASGLRREEMFLTGKVGSPLPLGALEVRRQLEVTLAQYNTSYVDLLMIHWPTSPGNSSSAQCSDRSPEYDPTGCRLESWREMLKLWRAGLARSIGVSNYNVEHLREIIHAGLPLPSINQVPYNPHLYTAQQDLLAFCRRQRIVFNSYSPLGIPDWHRYPSEISTTGRLLDEPKLQSLAAVRNLTTAQLLLAWQWQQRIPFNPRSMRPEHMRQNLDQRVFSINLTRQELAVLESFKPDRCTNQSSWYECCGSTAVQPSIPSCGQEPTVDSQQRSISWWFDVAENATVDAANAAAIKAHPAVFSRVMPYNSAIKLDGNVSNWWGQDVAVAKWNKPLQDMAVPVLPYLIDLDNSTIMHLVYQNATAVIADAVAIARHYNFQGWFIDYEDEYPPDTSPDKSQKLASFLTGLGDALHAHNMSLTICVASWSSMLSDYKTLANSSVDELQLMTTYSNPSSYKSIIGSYFEDVKAGSGDDWPSKAGVGIGIYYDGRNGYDRDWTRESATEFLDYVAAAGGTSLDIFRLLKDGEHDWPREPFWWDVLETFVNGG